MNANIKTIKERIRLNAEYIKYSKLILKKISNTNTKR